MTDEELWSEANDVLEAAKATSPKATMGIANREMIHPPSGFRILIARNARGGTRVIIADEQWIADSKGYGDPPPGN